MLFKVESAAPVSLLEMHILGPHPDFSNQNLYGWGPGICYNKPSRPCWCAWSLKCPGVLSGSNNTFLSVGWGLWGLNLVMWLYMWSSTAPTISEGSTRAVALLRNDWGRWVQRACRVRVWGQCEERWPQGGQEVCHILEPMKVLSLKKQSPNIYRALQRTVHIFLCIEMVRYLEIILLNVSFSNCDFVAYVFSFLLIQAVWRKLSQWNSWI